MIRRPHSTEPKESAPQELTPVQQQAMGLLDEISAIRRREESEPLSSLEVFYAGIDEKMIENEMEHIARRARDGGSRTPVSKEVAMEHIPAHRAEVLWRNGMHVARSGADLDQWMEVCALPEFHDIMDGRQKWISNPGPITGVSGVVLYNTISRLSNGDGQYISDMALRVVDLASRPDDDTSVATSMRRVARGCQQYAVRDILNRTQLSRINLGNTITPSEKALRIDDPEALLGMEIARVVEMNENAITTPSQALASLEFRRISRADKDLLTHIAESLGDALANQDNKSHLRESTDFVRGATRLLLSAVEFSASRDGLDSTNAKKFAQFFHENNRRNGRATVPSRKSVVVLANAIAPAMKAQEEFRDVDFPILTEDMPSDTHEALDRLFIFMEHEADLGKDSEVKEIIATVKACSLALYDHGTEKVTVREGNSKAYGDNPHALPREMGRSAARTAILGARAPGYGRMS